MNKQDPKLKRFASLIHKLKTLLKCPICLDVIQEAVELDCCHKLCDSCYHELVSKEMLKHCPICKATLKKPSTLYKDKYSDTIGKFVSVMGMQLENVYKLKVEALADAPQIDESNLTARVSKDVPKAINHRESNKPNKENVIVRKLPVRQAKPAEYLKTNLKIDNIPKNSQNSSEDDLFDKILGTSNTMRLNKKGTKTIYTNKQKINKKTEDEYRVLDFDDDETKQAVLNWLNDTRNHFDRLTQTQMMEPSHDEQGIDLPSVSQPNKRVKKRRRVRSLDFEKEKRPVTSKRYSDGHVMERDNYNIENPNTEGLILEEKLVEKAQQNVILHILEDEYLNKLEYEMVAPENNEVKEKNTGIAGVSLSSCNSGWNRITEIKETADKGGKVPKQLNIKLQNVEKTSPRNNEMVDFQQYKDQSPTEAAKQQQSPKLNKDILPEIQSSENVATPKSLYADIPANTLSKRQIVETDAATENKSTLPYVHGESANTTSPINEKDKVANKKICKSPLYKLQHKSDYISSRNNTQTDNTKAIQTSIGMADQNIHHATILPNHKNTPDGSVTKDVTALQNEDDESFGDYDIPTQKITAVCDSKFCEPVKKLLDFISEYVQTCLKEVDLEGALNAIDKIKAYVDRLKNNNVVHTSVQTSPVSKRDVFVETRLQTYDEAVQTGEVLKKMCSVQTFETFKKDAILQTESLSLKNVIENTLKSSQLLEKNMLNKCQENKANRNVEDELLTNSLDAIDFNTLDIVKNSHRVESSFDEKMQEMAASPRKRYVHQKIVRVPKVPNNRKDVKDKLPPEIKEALKNTSFEANQKRSREETELEETIKPKKKRNRFMMDALSVEFDNTYKYMTQETSFGDSSTEVNKIDTDHPRSSIEKNELVSNVLEKNNRNDEANSSCVSDVREMKQGFKIKGPTKYLDEFDEIIAKVSENIERLTKEGRAAQKTNQKLIEKVDSSPKNNCTSKLEDLKNQFPGYSSDIITESESIGTSPIKLKLQKASHEVASLDHSTHCTILNESEPNKICKNKNNMEVCQELQDSFDEKFANIHFSAPRQNEGTSKIKRLEHFKITIQDKVKLMDDDLFSDDDVVETTPQNSFRSPRKKYATDSRHGSVIIAESQDEEDLVFPALPPPLAFQDDLLVEMDTDETLKPNNTVQHLSPFVEHNPTSEFLYGINEHSTETSRRKCYKIHKKRLKHSTPKTSRRLSTSMLLFSPIREFSISHPTSTTAMKHNILTSTPRQKSMWNYVRASQSPQKKSVVADDSATDITAIEVDSKLNQTVKNTNLVPKMPRISFTRLSKDQVMCVSQMTSKKLATHTSTFDKSVTHMIVSVDKSGAAKDYTVKLMAAIASGIWVLKFDWVQKCLDTNSIAPEEPFEVLDDTGGQGPRTARLTRLKDPLLRNFKFYITDPLVSTTRQDIEDIIKMVGGVVVRSLKQLKKEPGFVELIITEGRATQDFEIYDRWLEQYKVVTIDIEWLSKSVGRYRQISFRPYMWCSDEALDELNYPEHLIEVVPYSVDP